MGFMYGNPAHMRASETPRAEAEREHGYMRHSEPGMK